MLWSSFQPGSQLASVSPFWQMHSHVDSSRTRLGPQRARRPESSTSGKHKKVKNCILSGFFFLFQIYEILCRVMIPRGWNTVTVRLAFSQEEKQIPLMLFQEGHPVFGTAHCGDPLRIREQLKLAHLHRHLMDCHEIWVRVRCSSSPEDEI